MRQRGQLGLIVPDGIVSGFIHRELRRTLVDRHTISDVIELSRDTFRRAEVKAHIVVIQKKPQGPRDIRVRQYVNGALSIPYLVSPESAVHRLDFSYYEQEHRFDARNLPTFPLVRLADLNPELQRGRATTVGRLSLPIPVFHVTDFPTSNRYAPARGYCWTEPLATEHNQVLAWPGDILLARVGRNLSKKVVGLIDGPIAISDCVYRLRVASQRERNRVLCVI